MLRKVLFVFICAAFLSGIACQSSGEPNANANRVNGNVNIDPKNMPAGLSTAPISPTSNTTPGIPNPANANRTGAGGTPTPGIPDKNMIGKPLPKGITPTPGIPDPATIKRQLNTPSNVNMQAAPSTRDNAPPTSGDSRMRKVGNKKPQ
jgi:hypothetical protein